eukprot:scaffold160_cov103-Isochrysis_galbana.AAC.3
MCKTAGANMCGTQTLSSSNIATVQECTVIDGSLEVFYLSMHTKRPLPTDPFVWLDPPPPPSARADHNGGCSGAPESSKCHRNCKGMYSAPSHSHAPRRPESHGCARIAPSVMNAQSNGAGDFAVRHPPPLLPT